MSRVVETFHTIRKRISPEGLAVATAISTASPLITLPVTVGAAYALHEASQGVDQNLLKVVVLGSLALANIVSIATEVKTLQKKGYSTSRAGTVTYAVTQRPTLSAAAEHVVLPLLNPITAVALAGHDHQLAVEGVAAASFALTAWRTGMNSLLLNGHIDPVVSSLRKAQQSVWHAVKTK